jgi:hypothetical protein
MLLAALRALAPLLEICVDLLHHDRLLHVLQQRFAFRQIQPECFQGECLSFDGQHALSLFTSLDLPNDLHASFHAQILLLSVHLVKRWLASAKLNRFGSRVRIAAVFDRCSGILPRALCGAAPGSGPVAPGKRRPAAEG